MVNLLLKRWPNTNEIFFLRKKIISRLGIIKLPKSMRLIKIRHENYKTYESKKQTDQLMAVLIYILHFSSTFRLINTLNLFIINQTKTLVSLLCSRFCSLSCQFSKVTLLWNQRPNYRLLGFQQKLLHHSSSLWPSVHWK